MKINLGGGHVGDFVAEEEGIQLEPGMPKMRYHGEIEGAGDDLEVFKTQRFSRGQDLVLKFPVPDGVYSVTLLFAETWKGAFQRGVRVFDVYVGSKPNGIVRVIPAMDMFAAAGGAKPIRRRFKNIAAQDGITIALRPLKQNPQIAGVVIEGHAYQTTLLDDLPTAPASPTDTAPDLSAVDRVAPVMHANQQNLYDPSGDPKFAQKGGSGGGAAPFSGGQGMFGGGNDGSSGFQGAGQHVAGMQVPGGSPQGVVGGAQPQFGAGNAGMAFGSPSGGQGIPGSADTAAAFGANAAGSPPGNGMQMGGMQMNGGMAGGMGAGMGGGMGGMGAGMGGAMNGGNAASFGAAPSGFRRRRLLQYGAPSSLHAAADPALEQFESVARSLGSAPQLPPIGGEEQQGAGLQGIAAPSAPEYRPSEYRPSEYRTAEARPLESRSAEYRSNEYRSAEHLSPENQAFEYRQAHQAAPTTLTSLDTANPQQLRQADADILDAPASTERGIGAAMDPSMAHGGIPTARANSDLMAGSVQSQPVASRLDLSPTDQAALPPARSGGLDASQMTGSEPGIHTLGTADAHGLPPASGLPPPPSDLSSRVDSQLLNPSAGPGVHPSSVGEPFDEPPQVDAPVSRMAAQGPSGDYGFDRTSLSTGELPAVHAGLPELGQAQLEHVERPQIKDPTGPEIHAIDPVAQANAQVAAAAFPSATSFGQAAVSRSQGDAPRRGLEAAPHVSVRAMQGPPRAFEPAATAAPPRSFAGEASLRTHDPVSEMGRSNGAASQGLPPVSQMQDQLKAPMHGAPVAGIDSRLSAADPAAPPKEPSLDPAVRQDEGILEQESGPPSYPGIHADGHKLNGVCLSNGTHCSCGVARNSAGEECLFVLGERSTGGNLCRKGPCGVRLQCECSSEGNMLCERRITTHLLVQDSVHSHDSTDNPEIVPCVRKTLDSPIPVLEPIDL